MDRLLKLGFSQQEINFLTNLLNYGQRPTSKTLASYGLNYEQAKRIQYMYGIWLGKTTIKNGDELAKHLKKMNTSGRKITINDLKFSDLQEIPRVACINGIKDENFDIYNTKRYKGYNGLYNNVLGVSSNNINIRTTRKPQLPYGKRGVPEVISIINYNKDSKEVDLAVNKRFIRLCNRYVITASTKRPTYHLGMYEIVCGEGTKIYVYAQNIGTKELHNCNTTNNRIYDFGIKKEEIKDKIVRQSKDIAQTFGGNVVNYYQGTETFNILNKVEIEPKEELYDEEDIY